MSALLLITNIEQGATHQYELSLNETRIGRSPEYNDLVLPGDKVSRRHALIRGGDGGQSILIDLDSANGTFVNGDKVKEHKLIEGDTITIDGFTLVFELSKAAPAVKYQSGHLGMTFMMRTPEQVSLGIPGVDEAYTSAVASPDALLEDVERLRRKAETLAHLYELNKVLSSVFSLDDIFNKVSDAIFRLTPAARLCVLMRKPGVPDLSPAIVKYRDGDVPHGGEKPISKTVLERVLTERVTLLSSDALTDQRLALARSLIVQAVHSVMCAPLFIKSEISGVIYVDCYDPLKYFGVDDLDLLNALAAAASMALDNADTHEQLVKEALARAAYGRFMPRHVVNEILADPSKVSLGGVNHVVTILFSDIRGFTSMAETLPPQTIVEILNDYFARMTPIVFEHKGMLDKYIGDGLMALFGVPYEQENAARAAILAAIAMQKAVIGLNLSLKSKGLPEIAIGIGINTGNVTVGYIGSEQRTDYTAIGDPVNLSARLEQRAEPWQILVSGATLSSVENEFTTRPFGEIKVKGKKEAVGVYEVLWRQPEVEVIESAPLQGLA